VAAARAQPAGAELLLRRRVGDQRRRLEAAAAGRPVPADRGRQRQRGDGHGHSRDAAAAGGIRISNNKETKF
jgi:hypothetical protein